MARFSLSFGCAIGGRPNPQWAARGPACPTPRPRLAPSSQAQQQAPGDFPGCQARPVWSSAFWSNQKEAPRPARAI